jgi:hypothetical protein
LCTALNAACVFCCCTIFTCSDLQECVPSDWLQQPATFLPNLTAAAAAGDANATELLQFGLAVHGLWKVLCRQVSGCMLLIAGRNGCYMVKLSYSILTSALNWAETRDNIFHNATGFSRYSIGFA